MGRHNFRQMRVHETKTLLLKVQPMTTRKPCWYQTMTDFPPAAALVRTQPVLHSDRPPQTTRLKKYKKPSKMFAPRQMTFEEDRLRSQFFADHPWELARPRILLENDGRDGDRWDWGLGYQEGRPSNGESVIQRQHWLMTVGPPQGDPATGRMVHIPLSREAAYDVARKELYERRHYDEVERRIQREEALAVGAQFGKSALEVGMQLENEQFDKWKEWAAQQVTIAEQARSAAYGGTPGSNQPEKKTKSLADVQQVLDRGLTGEDVDDGAVGADLDMEEATTRETLTP